MDLKIELGVTSMVIRIFVVSVHCDLRLIDHRQKIDGRQRTVTGTDGVASGLDCKSNSLPYEPNQTRPYFENLLNLRQHRRLPRPSMILRYSLQDSRTTDAARSGGEPTISGAATLATAMPSILRSGTNRCSCRSGSA